MLLGSKKHTVGDVRKWIIDYSHWLDNAAEILSATVTSSSTTCTIGTHTVVGREVIFFLEGGVLNEILTVTITMTDTFGNVKNDTLSFTVVAP